MVVNSVQPTYPTTCPRSAGGKHVPGCNPVPISATEVDVPDASAPRKSGNRYTRLGCASGRVLAQAQALFKARRVSLGSLARPSRSMPASLAPVHLDNRPSQARWRTCAAAQLDNGPKGTPTQGGNIKCKFMLLGSRSPSPSLPPLLDFRCTDPCDQKTTSTAPPPLTGALEIGRAHV